MEGPEAGLVVTPEAGSANLGDGRLGAGKAGAARLGALPILTLAFAALALIDSAADAQDLAQLGRELTALEGDARTLTGQRLRSDPIRSSTFVEERLTDGELFYRLQDYARASIIFTDVVEHHPSHRAFPDALYLLADSLFRAGDYLGARRRFSELLDHATEPRFRPYVQRALGRLIEVAIHVGDFSGVDAHFDRLSRLPPTEVEAATTYFRGKYLYNRALNQAGRSPSGAAGSSASVTPLPEAVDPFALDQAQQMFEAVPEGSPYALQSLYFIGVLYTLRGEIPEAVEAFRRVLNAPTGAGTPSAVDDVDGGVGGTSEQDLVELTQLALGRLYYESDRLSQAVEAYQSVSRRSARFDQALYEIAWVFIRMGDSTRAERALEVLALSSPNSPHIPDGQLLRGNLLLRNGRFEDAEDVFRTVRGQFGPLQRDLDEMIAEHDDVRAYFRNLVRENIETFDANDFLPPLAQQWASREGDMDRVLSLVGDLNAARHLVRETSALVDRLSAALEARNAVNVFADLRLQREKTVSLRNRLSRIRSKLMEAETRATGSGSAELQQVREERRQLERLFGGMPTEGSDFEVRNDQLLGRYRDLERELNQLQVELMGVEARIVATDRFLKETSAPPGTDFSLVEAEMESQRRAAAAYREAIDELGRAIERAKLQVGVGDARYERDGEVRARYDALIAREHTLLDSLGIRRPRELDVLFGRTAEIASILNRHDSEIDSVVAERRASMLTVLEEESGNVVRYRSALATLEEKAEDAIGTVAYLNYNAVRDRFLNLVLRADVGRIDVSWARREEHRMRVDMLTRERSREIQALEDEYREIMDLQEGSGGE